MVHVHVGSRSYSRVLAVCGALALQLGVIPAVSAQGVLEEITVTAQKREQSIQDVGISVTAFSGEQMRTLGFDQSIDVARMTPGVHTGGSIAGQTNLFTIRGVTQNDFTDSVESPVAVYLDEGYIAMGQGQTFGLFDLERVEIAKGPQSTLFGRNANGGVIQYVTNKPTREAEAYADVSYGAYDYMKFEGAISGPLSENLAVRLSALYTSFDDILDNNYTAADAPINQGTGLPMAGTPGGGEDMWNDDTVGVRGSLIFTPRDDMELYLMGMYTRQELSSGPYQSSPSMPVFDQAGNLVNTVKVGPNDVCEAITLGVPGCTPIPYVDGEDPGVPGVTVIGFNGLPVGLGGLVAPEDGVRPLPGGDFFGYVDEDGDGWDTKGDFAFSDLNHFESWGAHAKFTWDLDTFELTTVSDYKDFDKFVIMDVDAAPVPQSLFQGTAKTEQFSQEVRVTGETDRMRWLAGFYYLWIHNRTVNGLALPANSPLLGFGGPGLVVPFAGLDANGLIDLETNSYSLFGQVEYFLTDQLTLTVGVRGIEEMKDYQFDSFAFVNTDDTVIDTGIPVFPLPVDNLGNVSFSDDDSATLWAGKVQLDWRPTEDLLLYAGVNRGVKAGSYNAQLQDGSPRLAPEDIRYGEEVLLSYEGGFKATLFNGLTRLNGAVFYYDYDDYQAFIFRQSSGTVSNNDATTIGAEVELITSPFEGFDLMLSAAWFDMEIEDLQLGPNLFKDVEPSFAPPVQVAGLARYEWPAFNGGTMAVQADFNWSDRFYYNIRNFDSQKYDSYIVGNVRGSYMTADGHWTFTAFVKNIANERYGSMGFDLATLCGCNEDYYGPPRWWGVSVGYQY